MIKDKVELFLIFNLQKQKNAPIRARYMYTGIQRRIRIVYVSNLYESIKIPSDCCQPEGL